MFQGNYEDVKSTLVMCSKIPELLQHNENKAHINKTNKEQSIRRGRACKKCS